MKPLTINGVYIKRFGKLKVVYKAVLLNTVWTLFKELVLALKVSRSVDACDQTTQRPIGHTAESNVLEGTTVSYTDSTMASGAMVMHQSQATAVLMHSFFSRFSLYTLRLFFFQKIYKLPWQPYISTLIDMCPFHSTGRKSTYRALIGGFKWWKTGVFWSVFPENSYNENLSGYSVLSDVRDSANHWIYRSPVDNH